MISPDGYCGRFPVIGYVHREGFAVCDSCAYWPAPQRAIPLTKQPQSCEFSQKAVGAGTFGLLAHRQRAGSLRPMNRVTAELIAIAIVILLVAVTLGCGTCSIGGVAQSVELVASCAPRNRIRMIRIVVFPRLVAGSNPAPRVAAGELSCGTNCLGGAFAETARAARTRRQKGPTSRTRSGADSPTGLSIAASQ